MTNSKRYEYTDVILPDLARTSNVLDNFVIYRCRIAGPAILFLGDDCIFASNWSNTGPDDGLFWEVPADWTTGTGVIAAINSTFEECYFHRVGFAGKAESITQLRNTLDYWQGPQPSSWPV